MVNHIITVVRGTAKLNGFSHFYLRVDSTSVRHTAVNYYNMYNVH